METTARRAGRGPGEGEVRAERRAGQVEGGQGAEGARGSTGPLYNSKTIESAASVTYPRARGRRVCCREGIVKLKKKRERERESVVAIKERERRRGR